jgi:hypothetical protein
MHHIYLNFGGNFRHSIFLHHFECRNFGGILTASAYRIFVPFSLSISFVFTPITETPPALFSNFLLECVLFGGSSFDLCFASPGTFRYFSHSIFMIMF